MSISCKLKNSQGYSMVEMLMAMVVGSIILAGTYAAFNIVAKQYDRDIGFVEVQEMGIPTLRLISRDLRMAGYKALDANLESDYGAITTPIAITDSGDACCDVLQVIYDRSTTDRRRITYYTGARTNPVTRNALYMDVETWNGSSWDVSINQSLVADYIEDFQAVGSDNDGSGNPRIVDIVLIIRGVTAQKSAINYTKPAYLPGNYNLTANDLYHRDEFHATINIKNLRY